MPLVVLAPEHKEHLQFLSTLGQDAVADFARISVDLIQKGVNPNLYQSAAKKLQVEAEVVQRALEGIMYLLSECAKLSVSDMDFHDSVMTLGFKEELIQTLLQVYTESRDQIRSSLARMTVGIPSYSDLEWRLDVQVASRALKNQVEPSIVLKLNTTDGKQHVLQTDPATLLHVAQKLEDALKEIKTSHFRRATRILK